jgi:hypothetical protein
VAWIREKRDARRILVEKTPEERPLGRSARRYEDNIKAYLWDAG